MRFESLIGGDYYARVRGAACAFQHGGPLFIRVNEIPITIPALTRLQFLETLLFARDTSLLVGVQQVNPFLSYSLRLFRVMGIVTTRAADTGKLCPLHEHFPSPSAEYSVNSFPRGFLYQLTVVQ